MTSLLALRRPYLAGNWKMNLDRKGAVELAKAIRDNAVSDRDVAICPPFVYLEAVADLVKGSSVRLGGQNLCDRENGAFTGEVSAEMLLDVGADLVIIGHSERRHVYGESDELVNAKVHRALAVGLEVILCIGETLEERQAGETESVVRRQVTEGLAGVDAGSMERLTLAYEPVWAIGTGLTASPEQAGEVHQYVRGLASGLYDDRVAQSVRIQYGGSVKPGNVADLMAVPDIDGALVGGAALEAESFLSLIAFDR